MNERTFLQKQKNAAVDRMQALVDLAKKEGRDLSGAETVEYESKKSLAQGFIACLRELEQETDVAAPPAAQPAAPLGFNRWGVPYLVDGAAVHRGLEG